MKIRRQEAFDIAIRAIRELPFSEKNEAAIGYLEVARNERYIKYADKSPDEWVADFILQYEEILPSSADDYDLRRRQDSPSWITVARYAKLSTWYELISFTGVCQSCLKRKYRLKSEPREWTVRSTSHFLDEYIKLKEHIDDMFEKKLDE